MFQQVNAKLHANVVKNKATIFWIFHFKEFLLVHKIKVNN